MLLLLSLISSIDFLRPVVTRLQSVRIPLQRQVYLYLYNITYEPPTLCILSLLYYYYTHMWSRDTSDSVTNNGNQTVVCASIKISLWMCLAGVFVRRVSRGGTYVHNIIYCVQKQCGANYWAAHIIYYSVCIHNRGRPNSKSCFNSFRFVLFEWTSTIS